VWQKRCIAGRCWRLRPFQHTVRKQGNNTHFVTAWAFPWSGNGPLLTRQMLSWLAIVLTYCSNVLNVLAAVWGACKQTRDCLIFNMTFGPVGLMIYGHTYRYTHIMGMRGETYKRLLTVVIRARLSSSHKHCSLCFSRHTFFLPVLQLLKCMHHEKSLGC
jgi:hypothetical protein